MHYLEKDCVNYANNIIPNSVKVVKRMAFFNSDITSITIPENVEYVEDSAFENCIELTSVTINANEISFGDRVFSGCSSLTSIDIPKSVVRIGTFCFIYIKDITYPDNRDKIIPGAYSGWEGRSIEIPEGIIEIGENAFFYCVQLESINIPGTVKKIGSYAFSYCSKLASVTIPDGVTEIGKNAFSSCYQLVSINIPGTVKKIGSYAFFSCHSLKSITIQDGVTEIGNDAFSSCYQLVSINIPNSVEKIGYSAFYSSTQIIVNEIKSQNDVIPIFKYYKQTFETDEFTILSNIRNISSYAFSGCSLKTIDLSNVEEIGSCAFADCPNLQSINLPDSLIKIDSYAFYNCRKLETINLPHNLQYFGEHVIDATSITTLVIPDSVEFYGIQNIDNVPITSIKLPSCMKEIKEREFYQSKFKTIILPDKLEIIGNSSFFESHLLESIIIPKNVKSIIDSAFSYCEKLTNLTFLGNVMHFGKNCFAGTNITEITIPNSATFFSDSLYNCKNLQNITFGEMNFSISIDYYDGILFDETTQHKELEVRYIGNDRNDYNVNFAFYDLIKKYGRLVYVKDTYEIDTFCTKQIRKYHVDEPDKHFRVCECNINFYNRPMYRLSQENVVSPDRNIQ